MSLHKIYTTITSWLKWLAIYLLIGVIVGTATAFFLQTLDDVTLFREEHVWIIYFLPIAGLVIGLLYYYYGTAANPLLAEGEMGIETDTDLFKIGDGILNWKITDSFHLKKYKILTLIDKIDVKEEHI